MDLALLKQMDKYEWHILPKDNMRVPAIIFATQKLIQDMDMKVYEQICNVATLPGIVQAAYAMPDAHWGYGFPVGGVAAFDPDEGGVVSAGGVGFDISCGVRLLLTGLKRYHIEPIKEVLADALYAFIPAGVGSTSAVQLSLDEIDDMLLGGARWAINKGFGYKEDLEFSEEQGCVSGADPEAVSVRAKERQRQEMGTLGSGNHYLEVQEVKEIYDERIAQIFNLNVGDIVVSIHCGSRGLGHQIGTDYLRTMAIEAIDHGIHLPDRELASAPINSATGQLYLGAMRAAINCALANRQIISHFARNAFQAIIPKSSLSLMYDVSHNTCKEEWHTINGKKQRLFVHRKGATRAFGPGHKDLPEVYAEAGQPVIIGGSMGTCSYVLVGTQTGEEKSLSSACHGAGRAMSRTQASKRWRGEEVINDLAKRGIIIRSVSPRDVAEEAPHAYKDVNAVVDTAHHAGLAKKIAKLVPVICVKG